MKTPFTTGQFFSVFEKYNHTLFPSQILIFLAGLIALFLIFRDNKGKDVYSSLLLVFVWIWVGIAYHIAFFSEINKAAFAFGGIFILQGLLLLWDCFFKRRFQISFEKNLRGYLGMFFIIYGLLIYPVIAFLAVGDFSHIISLGLPCPTVIMTFGFLMLTGSKLPKYLLIIPSVWAIFGLSAVINLGVYQDAMILISALVCDYFLLKKPRTVITLSD